MRSCQLASASLAPSGFASLLISGSSMSPTVSVLESTSGPICVKAISRRKARSTNEKSQTGALS